LQARLDTAAAEAVSKLLPKSAENDLASQCSWPDDVRKVIPWSSALHFADTPDSVCSYDHTSKLLFPLKSFKYFLHHSLDKMQILPRSDTLSYTFKLNLCV